MARGDSTDLFNRISRVYGLFYGRQKREFARVIAEAAAVLDLSRYRSALDVGCGTGALCSALHDMGLEVTGIDQAERMLEFARSKPENGGIRFLRASALAALPFEDGSFDISIASHVAHGMGRHERRRMYEEMSRVTRRAVVIHDYNRRRSAMTTLLEWMEGGDYFHFVRNAESEMQDCVSGPGACFERLEILPVSRGASWYICAPKHTR